MAGNPRKRKRGKNRAIEVPWDSVPEDIPTVTYKHTHYDTPVGRITKRNEVPYKYVPSAPSAPKPAQSNVTMNDDFVGMFDTGVGQEPEPPGTIPTKKINKVPNSITCTATASIDIQ